MDLLGAGGRGRLLLSALLAFFVVLLVAEAAGGERDAARRVLEGGVELQRNFITTLCSTGVSI